MFKYKSNIKGFYIFVSNAFLMMVYNNELVIYSCSCYKIWHSFADLWMNPRIHRLVYRYKITCLSIILLCPCGRACWSKYFLERCCTCVYACDLVIYPYHQSMPLLYLKSKKNMEHHQHDVFFIICFNLVIPNVSPLASSGFFFGICTSL